MFFALFQKNYYDYIADTKDKNMSKNEGRKSRV